MFSGRSFSIVHCAKSVLCIILVLHLSLLTPGCGSSVGNGLAGNPLITIPLTGDDALSKSLSATGFAGAKTLTFNTQTHEFQVFYPDAGRSLSGQLELVGSSWEMSNFVFQNDGKAGSMQFDPQTGQVTSILTSQGDVWQPSKNATGARAIGQDRLSNLLAANDELISLSSNNPDKPESSFILIPIFSVFIMFLWVLCADSVVYCPGFGPIFAVIVAILGSIPPPVPAGNTVVTTPAVNNPPVAKNDAFSTPRNTAVSGNVLADNGNGVDSDPDSDPLVTSIATQPTNGSVVLQGSGVFTYTPNTDFTGIDTFTYTLSDGQGGTSTATVTITVVAVNRPPVARNDAFSGFADNDVTGNVLVANGSGADSDPDGDTLTVISVNGVTGNLGHNITLPSGAQVNLGADGSFTYFAPDTTLVDTFTYTISDGKGGTSTATVTLTITFPD